MEKINSQQRLKSTSLLKYVSHKRTHAHDTSLIARMFRQDKQTIAKEASLDWVITYAGWPLPSVQIFTQTFKRKK